VTDAAAHDGVRLREGLIDEASQFEDAARDGRAGLGTVMVFAAGNSWREGARSDLHSQ